jgi:hypothetical protein
MEDAARTTQTVLPQPALAQSADPLDAGMEAEAKLDPLSLLAVDANELARAIWSGQGSDVSRLVADLLKGRNAA